MVKFKATQANGRILVGLGLSEGNVELLRQGKPAHIAGEEVQVPNLDLVIFYGATEDDLVDKVKPYIGEPTEVLDQRKRKKM